jgi:chromosomal replication initiator protein
MYMAREMTTMSLPEIGREMQRDHTTVWYAAEKLAKRGRGATKLNRDIAKIKQLVA